MASDRHLHCLRLCSRWTLDLQARDSRAGEGRAPPRGRRRRRVRRTLPAASTSAWLPRRVHLPAPPQARVVRSCTFLHHIRFIRLLHTLALDRRRGSTMTCTHVPVCQFRHVAAACERGNLPKPIWSLNVEKLSTFWAAVSRADTSAVSAAYSRSCCTSLSLATRSSSSGL